VQDPVHGRIWLTELEIELINTPEFQRLRRIGQLSPADLVFPGATHNRFAHSLGATHVMGWILRQQNMQDYFKESDRTNFIPLLRVAALLHDIGHLPFSHVGETAWSIAGSGNFGSYAEEDGISVFDVAAEERARSPYHEKLSVALIRSERISEIINRHLPGEEFDGSDATEAVARIVNGDEPNLVMRSLLSSDLDCDRLDYLLRDSLAAGLVYGHVDLSYLIGNLVVCRRKKPEDADPDYDDAVLAIDDRHGLLAGEHYLLARYYHYAQFISHKTITSAEVTLTAAILELIRAEALPRPEQVDAMVRDPTRADEFLRLTDGYVESQIASAPADHQGHDDLVEAARRLTERKLMKTPGRGEGLEKKRKAGDPPRSHPWDTRLGSPERKREFADSIGIDPDYFCFSRTSQGLSGAEAGMSPSDFVEGDRADMERSWEKGAKVGEHEGKPRLLIDASSVLRHLSGRVWATRRVYAREPLDEYGSSGRTARFEALRGELEGLLREQ
jgi:HD superfamily phosphohydrolase